MSEEAKTRKPRADKGVPRGPRVSRTTPVGDAPDTSAPIHVTVCLKSGVTVEFGCARRIVENGFHVFFYPSQYDRYRESRREFAISEIVDLEITEARQAYDLRPQPKAVETLDFVPHVPAAPKGPQIYSPRKNRSQPAGDLISRLEQSSGPVAIGAEEAGMSLGVGASVAGIGDHVA